MLIVDLDVHQGNGSARIFAGDDRVFTASFQCEGNFFSARESSDLDVVTGGSTASGESNGRRLRRPRPRRPRRPLAPDPPATPPPLHVLHLVPHAYVVRLRTRLLAQLARLTGLANRVR